MKKEFKTYDTALLLIKRKINVSLPHIELKVIIIDALFHGDLDLEGHEYYSVLFFANSNQEINHKDFHGPVNNKCKIIPYCRIVLTEKTINWNHIMKV